MYREYRSAFYPAYRILVQLAKEKTATGDILADEPAAATESTEIDRPTYHTTRRRGEQLK